MKLLRIISHSKEQSQKIASVFARGLFLHSASSKKAIVIGLKGELGSGKTTFVKGFARGLGIKKIIQSPTFVIAKNYSLRITHYALLIHVDAHRLKSGKDLVYLGWDEWIKDPKNIILVEWAERVKKILPKHRFEIHFKHLVGNKRKITFHIF